MSENQKDKKAFFTEWLEQLQQESWQLELLISGLALFGIWESQELLLRLRYFIEVDSVDSFRSYLNVILFILETGWVIFLINLLIHIVLRGFWIGAIGLRYVSGDIDYDQLNYSDRFVNYFKNTIGGFDDYIERIERASSVIFSFTFLLFFLLISVIVYFTLFGLAAQLIGLLEIENDLFNGFKGVLGGLYFLLGILVLIDFFTLGAFKKIKDPTVSKIYLVLYRFYSIVTLSFLSRPLLLNFMDNRYTRRLIFLAIPYALVILFGQNMIRYDRYSLFPDMETIERGYRDMSHGIDWRYYDDERVKHQTTFARDSENPPKQKIRTASLNTYDITRGSELKVFIEYQEFDEERIEDAYKKFIPLREKEVSFGLFKKAKAVDTLEQKIYKEKRQELKQMRLAARGKPYNGKSAAEKKYYDQYVGSTAEDISKLETDINRIYDGQLSDLRAKNMGDIVQGLLSFNKVRIDGDIVNNRLDCSFYIHPNMHERGVMCFLSTDSLSLGNHTLDIDKENCDKCMGRALRIPFRVVK